MKFKIYEITSIKAINASAGDTEPQDAILVHHIGDEFGDDDCILFEYTKEFESDDEITDTLQNETPSIAFTISEKTGVYVCW